MRGDNAANLPMFAGDLRDFFPGAHIDTVAAFFLQHQIRGDRIKHL